MIGILIVHDYEPTRQLLDEIVRSRGFEVKVSGSGEAMHNLLKEEAIGLVIADADSLQPNCEAFMRSVRLTMPNLPVVMMVNDPADGGDQVDMKFKMMDLNKRLDEILAMAKPQPRERIWPD